MLSLFILLLFAFPIIIPAVSKNRKGLIFSLICFAPVLLLNIIKLIGYGFSPAVEDHTLCFFALLLIASTVFSVKPAWPKVMIVIFFLLFFLLVFTLFQRYSVDVVIDDIEYSASIPYFHKGITEVVYNEKVFGPIYKSKPSFYAATFNLGSMESAGNKVLNGDVVGFYDSAEEAIDALIALD